MAGWKEEYVYEGEEESCSDSCAPRTSQRVSDMRAIRGEDEDGAPWLSSLARALTAGGGDRSASIVPRRRESDQSRACSCMAVRGDIKGLGWKHGARREDEQEQEQEEQEEDECEQGEMR